ncbi:hypothetical protein L3Y34_007655 [Caenorhabditis briggsae]|uniref:FYVE-type domain-containing protein n=1 Tax=Caenorhabditis briggsae TaxID=6238 RepID=A0AAE9A7A8_CAEBR|nr:hypothetical protein L3Y34_007655 [Caenorhabditis briggsae]
MPSSICCTNCRTKYSLLNREAGCSSCALSFCKKCLGHRAIIPTLSDQPMIVCYNCYQNTAFIKPTVVTKLFQKLNQSVNRAMNYNRPASQMPQQQPQKIAHVNVEDLEQRRAKLREDMEPPVEALTIDEIEERLAKLRECDVEVIRNPRSWLTSSSKDGPAINANNPAELMRIAEDRARIEQKEEEMEAKDWEELEARRRKIFDKEPEEGEKEDTAVRESMVSGSTEFSEATKEEMNEINNLLIDAEKRCAETKKQEEHDASEMRNLMKASRQKSLDAMQWNDKITKEIGGFWDRQNAKSEEEDEDDKSLDEETFKKILHEAENSVDVEPPTEENTTTTAPNSFSSPKKKGFFEKLFRKDSKQ